MFKEVEVTFAERACLSAVLSRQGGTLEEARHIKEIRRRFCLRDAVRVLDLVNLGLARYGKRATWDEILDDLKPVKEWAEGELEKAGPEADSDGAWDFEVLNEIVANAGKVDGPRTFTIDGAYIRWLLDVFKGIDWAVVKRRTADGAIKEERVPVELGLQEAFASLAEALEGAKPVKEEGDG
jgi:hypothetical protein